MTLRARLLSLTLSTVAIVAVTLVTLSLNNLTSTLLDVSVSSSEMAGRQIQSYLLRRLPETIGDNSAEPVSPERLRDFWNVAISKDEELAAMLEQTMAQSRSIVEIGIARDDGVIITSSNPQSRNTLMVTRQDLHAIHDTGPIGRILAILSPNGDFETRVPLGLAGKPEDTSKRPLFTIQILTSPVLLRAAILPAMRNIVAVSGLAILIAFLVAWWVSDMTLKPLARISHIIDDIVSGEPLPPLSLTQDSRELAIIEAKLNLLGERFRGAREDATHLRSSLEGAMEKLDLGTRRQLENQIALARRLTAINSLTGRVAHEIKNPLNSIALRLEMLRSRLTGEPQDVDEQFAVLTSEVMRLDRVVRTFLDFNRPVDLCLEDVDLAEAAAEVIAFIEPEAAARRIRTSFERPDRTFVLEGDRDLLRQALLNIAVNAIEAMEGADGDGAEAGGSEAAGVVGERGELRIHMTQTDDSCVVAIADTGPGIPPDQKEKIFQLYYTTRPQGTGIGLAMAFRAAQLHGGTIEVDSEMGKGTEFRIVLPLLDKHPGKLPTASGQAV